MRKKNGFVKKSFTSIFLFLLLGIFFDLAITVEPTSLETMNNNTLATNIQPNRMTNMTNYVESNGDPLIEPLSTYTGNVEDDCPWFTLENVSSAGIVDDAFAKVIYETVYSATDTSFETDSNTYIYMLPGFYYGTEINDYYDLIQFIDSKTDWTDVEKTKYFLHFFAGEINAENKGIKSIEGIDLLSDARMNLQNNLIESLYPLSSESLNKPLISIPIDISNNPIHMFSKYLSSVSTPEMYIISVSTSILSDKILRYHYDDNAKISVDLDVSNNDEKAYLWNTNELITDPRQKNVDIYINSTTGKKYYSKIDANTYTSLNDEINDKTFMVYFSPVSNYSVSSEIGDPDTNEGPFGTENGNRQMNAFYFSYIINLNRYASIKQKTTAEVYGGFTFTKTNESGDINLAGAEYELYDSNDNKVTKIYKFDNDGNKNEVLLTPNDLTTATDGKIQIKYLPEGSYYLKEIKAPEGYSINTTPISVKIEANSLKTSIEGGVKSFEASPMESSMKPEWSNYLAKNAKYVEGKITSGADTKKTATDYNADTLVTNYSSTGWIIKNSKKNIGDVLNEDYATIDYLKSQLDQTEKDNFSEYSVVKVVMDNDNVPEYEYDSLEKAKDAINNITKTNTLKGNITIKSDTIYVMKDEAIDDNEVSQKNEKLDINPEETNTPPKTNDKVTKYMISFIVSLIAIITICIVKKTRKKFN